MVTIQIGHNGIITLPVELCKRYGLDEGDVLTLQDLGDGSFLLIPSVSCVTDLGDRVAQRIAEQGTNTEEILAALEEERESYYREHYDQP